MRLIKLSVVLLFILSTISCKNEKKVVISEKSQMEEVIAVHDEVMPKMGKIGSLITQIDAKIQETDSSEVLLKASQDLKDSNKEMMDWMKGFGERFDSDEILKGKSLTAEKQKFLDEEEAKINALRDKMNSSIKNAEDLLK